MKCPTCKGSGEQPDRSPVLRTPSPFMGDAFPEACETCNGTGEVPDEEE